MSFVSDYATPIIAVLPAVFIVVGVLSLAVFLALWLRARRAWGAARPRRGLRVLSFLVFSWCVTGLIVAYGPMAPLFQSARRLEAKRGEAVPDMSFRRVADGTAQKLTDFRGKVVLVNLWATWCPPCREELPALNRVQNAFRDRGLVVITLSDQPPAELAAFVAERSPDTVNGSVASFGWLAVETFRPFTLIVDRKGILRDYMFGAYDDAVFRRKVSRWLD